MNGNSPNIQNEREQMLFEEVNRWHRFIISTIWLTTSFFISLNLLIIREANKCSVNNVVEKNVFWGLVFTVLCIIEFSVSISLIIISVNLARLVDINDDDFQQKKQKFLQALKPNWRDFFSPKILEAIKTPWAIVTIAFTVTFILAWWKLIYNWEFNSSCLGLDKIFEYLVELLYF